MPGQQSRVIGGFLKALLLEEEIECLQYPTLSIVRSSPKGQIDPIWTLNQLAQCYAVTSTYLIEAEEIVVKGDESGQYGVDYLCIVLRREEESGKWAVNVYTNIEDIYPETNDQRILMERFARFGERARKAILAFV